MIERRNFIKGMTATLALPALLNNLGAAQTSNAVIKPKALKKGATVGVIAPGTAVSDPVDINKAKEVLDYFDLKMKLGNSVNKGSGYKTRSVKERLDDLHQMFEDKSVDAVFCIRGGYGSIQILDKIDYELIRNNPKIFIGYSDITAMHLAINKMTGLVTFHGPLLLSGFNSYTVKYFQKVLFDSSKIGTISNPQSNGGIRNPNRVRVLKQGTASGKLVGGNLSMIAALMGTKYEMDTNGKIFFFEDVGEEPYRIDRMLYQLKIAGKLNQANGIIFGTCEECGAKSPNLWDGSLAEIIELVFADVNKPMLANIAIGHGDNQLTVPMGLEAELDTNLGVFNILENAVV